MRADIWLLAPVVNQDGRNEGPNIWAAEVRPGATTPAVLPLPHHFGHQVFDVSAGGGGGAATFKATRVRAIKKLQAKTRSRLHISLIKGA